MGKKLKRICYVNPGINIRRPISFIMNSLKKKGYKISILTPRKKHAGKREKTRHYDEFESINVLTYPVWTKNSGFIWPIPTNIDFFKKCWKVLKENDIIQVWVPFYPNTFITCLLKLLFFKEKTLILTMDTFPAYSFKTFPALDILFKIFFKTVGKVAFFASNYICIYGKSFLKYSKKAGVPQNKIRITPTGISLNVKPAEINIRKLFSIEENDRIILFVGLHNNRKGIDLIIKTASFLQDDTIKFILVGDGPERETGIKLVKDLKLDKNVIFIGTRLDVHNFYNNADIFFLPSRGEGLAGVLMEAMVYQVPIVTSNIAGTRDLVKHMNNGLLCEIEDYRCYARNIEKLLVKPDLIKKFKLNGLKMIENYYLWDKNIKKFEKIYNLVKN
jgi:glycosyltransferase involved in cell wall biosynthesis